MKERIMTTVERLRLIVIEELIEGNINGTTAANRLNLSIRQIKRLKKKYMEEGHDSLIHKARGRTGVRKTNISVENNIVRIIKEQYYDFGPTMAWEKLQEVYSITYSDETIRAIMIRSSPVVLTEHKSNWIPPKDHPWRQFQYT